MKPLSLVLTTEKGEFRSEIRQPNRERIVEAIERLYVEHDENVFGLRVEMPYSEGTFTYPVEDPDLSAEENASWILDAIQNFRY